LRTRRTLSSRIVADGYSAKWVRFLTIRGGKRAVLGLSIRFRPVRPESGLDDAALNAPRRDGAYLGTKLFSKNFQKGPRLSALSRRERMAPIDTRGSPGRQAAERLNARHHQMTRRASPQ